MWPMVQSLGWFPMSELPKIDAKFANPDEPYVSYKRNPETLARTQAIPGQPGLEHRIGGLEKGGRWWR